MKKSEANPKRERSGVRGHRAGTRQSQSSGRPDALPPSAIKLLEDLHLHQEELDALNAELRRIQKDLEASRDRYFRLYDLAPIGYVTMDRNALIRDINLTGSEMLCREREDVIGRMFTEFIASSDLLILQTHRKEVLECRGRQTCELRLSPEGKGAWLRIVSTPILDISEEVSGIHSAFIDITERKAVEERLTRFHRRDQAFADGAPDIIAILDRRLRFIYVNPAMEKLLGINPARLSGKTAEEMGMPAEFCKIWNESLTSVMRSGEVRTIEFEYPSPGGLKYFHGSLIPDTTDAERIESVVGFVRDFTMHRNTRIELEKEVLERTAELERMNLGMRNEISQREKFEKALQFSTAQIIEHSRRRKYLSKRLVELLEQDRRDMAMALHDQIGQILTTLKMELELLKKRVPEEESKTILESAIEKASQAMSFSRNISQELRPAMLDTLGLVPSIESQIEGLRESSGLQITFFHSGITTRLGSGKELTLYRILQEALTNVMKHASARNVHVSLIRKGNSALLTVEDDGVGFEYRKIASSEKGPLGIMIMKERAVQVGGTVDIESRPGKGTHLAARVPMQEEG